MDIIGKNIMNCQQSVEKNALPCYLKRMKNKILTALIIFLFVQIAYAYEIKVLLGMNSSSYMFSNSTDLLQTQQKIGVAFGLGWTFSLSMNMKIEIDAMFNQKGTKATITYTADTVIPAVYKNSSIAIPVFFKYQFREKTSPYFSFGPEFVFITSHHLIFPESNGEYDLSDNTRKLILAFNAAVGYEYPIGKWGLSAEIRYNHWFSSLLIDPEAAVKSSAFTFLLGGIYYL